MMTHLARTARTHVGKPSPTGEGIVENPPLQMDTAITTEPPKPLDAWLADNADKLRVCSPKHGKHVLGQHARSRSCSLTHRLFRRWLLQGGCVPMWSGDDFEIAFVGSQAQLASTTYDKEVRTLYT
jgi:hypothetical protein